MLIWRQYTATAGGAVVKPATCEECGTELVLLVRGSGKAPRHCGGSMHERAELLSN